jgi:hypothetical protein
LIEEVFQQVFEFRDVFLLLLGLVSRLDRRRGWRNRRILRGDLCIRYSGLSMDGLLDEGRSSILFDTEGRFEMAIIFVLAISLTFVTLSNISFVFWRFEFFELLYLFYIEYVHKQHGKW